MKMDTKLKNSEGSAYVKICAAFLSKVEGKGPLWLANKGKMWHYKRE